MFDLKAKLLAKGLVTQEQVEKVEKASVGRQKKPAQRQEIPAEDDFEARQRKRFLDALQSQPKAEQYVTIRKWVDINRLDKPLGGLIGEKFFLTGKDNQVTWLLLKPEVIEEIKKGNAAVIAYMSNHGLTHAVVPREIGEDVGVVYPDWLKVLNDKN